MLFDLSRNTNELVLELHSLASVGILLILKSEPWFCFAREFVYRIEGSIINS